MIVGLEALLGQPLGVSSISRSAARTSFCTSRIALIRRWRERSVMFSRPISCAISMRSRATLRRKRSQLFGLLAARDFLFSAQLDPFLQRLLEKLVEYSRCPRWSSLRYSSALSSSPASSACSEKLTTSRMFSMCRPPALRRSSAVRRPRSANARSLSEF